MKENLVALVLFLIPFCINAQDCTCEDNFNWVRSTFEENDAGFQYALEQKGQPAYDKHNEVYLERVKAIQDICKKTNKEL